MAGMSCAPPLMLMAARVDGTLVPLPSTRYTAEGCFAKMPSPPLSSTWTTVSDSEPAKGPSVGPKHRGQAGPHGQLSHGTTPTMAPGLEAHWGCEQAGGVLCAVCGARGGGGHSCCEEMGHT
jgi:hypothetical protein